MFLKMKIEPFMKKHLHDGYRETIALGLAEVRKLNSARLQQTPSQIEDLARAIKKADAVVVGAGAGLSTSAGFSYAGDRFHHYFFDFQEKYGITDMYTGGFFPFPDKATYWAWWARSIYVNRYMAAPKPVYQDLKRVLAGKDYFVLTTNTDHQFQAAGFEKKRLFYTQGDYGLFQIDGETFDNRSWVLAAMAAQGFVLDENGVYQVPDDRQLKLTLPEALLPEADVALNLRVDESFVEDAGWKKASAAYATFLKKHQKKRVLYLELGVGGNTPVIIKYPFWAMALKNPKATYACLNYGEACALMALGERAIVLNGDIGEVLKQL